MVLELQGVHSLELLLGRYLLSGINCGAPNVRVTCYARCIPCMHACMMFEVLSCKANYNLPAEQLPLNYLGVIYYCCSVP